MEIIIPPLGLVYRRI